MGKDAHVPELEGRGTPVFETVADPVDPSIDIAPRKQIPISTGFVDR